MEPPQRILVTDDTYLEIERRAEGKSELLHGEIVAMAGGSPKHNALSLNVGAALRQRFREQRARCVAFSSDQRIHVEATGLSTYADV
ncbi:MAG: Uma2 family endonuclease, partial [Minicystis sp.]